MITLKLNRYSHAEKIALADLLSEMQCMLEGAICPQTDCRVCPYKNLCYDIEKINEHIATKI